MMPTTKHTTVLVAMALLAAAALFAPACSRDEDETPAPEPAPQQPDGDMPIYFNVAAENDATDATRYLVGNEYPPATDENGTPITTTHYLYQIPLESACTPNDEFIDKNRDGVISDDEKTPDGKGYGFAVGLFSDFTYTDSNGKIATERDFFKGARIVYSNSAGDNPVSAWNYENITTKSWTANAKYIFRAYYPQKLYNYTVSNSEKTTSNATTLAIVYPTRKLQYDLLIGHSWVETGNSARGNIVDIHMEHALAALRFEFKLDFDDYDWLTSVYFLNDKDRQFCSQGTISYGRPAAIEGNDPTKEDLEYVQWHQDYFPRVNEVFFKWKPAKKYWDLGNEDFAKEIEELLKIENNPVFMSSNGIDVDGTVQHDGKHAIAYYGTPEGTPDCPEEGELYCRNSGWLMIVPQKSTGTLTMCFTTKRGGETLYKVKLPQTTETDASGNAVSTEWEAGKRYTYVVTMSKSDLTIDVTVKPWNERNHSTEIVF